MTDLKEHEDSLPEWSTDEDDEEVESKYPWFPYKTGEIPRYVPPNKTSVYTRPDPVEDAPEDAEEAAEDVAAEGEEDGGKKKKKKEKKPKGRISLKTIMIDQIIVKFKSQKFINFEKHILKNSKILMKNEKSTKRGSTTFGPSGDP